MCAQGMQVYTYVMGHIVLKTCIANFGIATWYTMDGYTEGIHWIYAQTCMGEYRYTWVYTDIHERARVYTGIYYICVHI